MIKSMVLNMNISQIRAKIESTSLKNNGVKNPFEVLNFESKIKYDKKSWCGKLYV